MNLSVETRGDVMIARVRCEKLEQAEARELKDHLAAILENRPRGVVLDLSSVVEIDSAGLGALIATLKKARAHGGAIALCGLSDGVRAVLELTLLHRVLPVHRDQEEALREIRAAVSAGR